jgi:hypothetical protein
VIGGEGLEEIGACAFASCTLLQEITIHPGVKAIEFQTFHGCIQLTIVNLSDGLEEIRKEAFFECTSLQSIIIPHTVRAIHKEAFSRCTSLTSVMFCDEIQEFVTTKESMRDWWNHGVHEKSLSTYCFLLNCNIPQRLDLLRLSEWQINIHEMLRRIPLISAEDMDAYFDTINSRLSNYEHYLKDAPILLELAIWKLKMPNELSHSTIDMKMQCRTDSLSMVTIIVRNVLTFL